MSFDVCKDIQDAINKQPNVPKQEKRPLMPPTLPPRVKELRQQIETLNEIKDRYIESIQRIDLEKRILQSGLKAIDKEIERKEQNIQDLYKRNFIPLNMNGGDDDD